MNISELVNDKLNLHLRVTVPSKDIESEIDKEIAKIAKTAKIDGFRVGKVPVHMLKKRHADSFRGDVYRNIIARSISDINKERKLRSAADPGITDVIAEADKDLEFTLKFELLPEISLPDLSKISLERPVLEVSDNEIDEELNKLLELAKTFDKETKAKAKKGDQVTIDATGFADGEEFSGGKLDGFKLVLGSGVFIPGFEDQLIGSKAGEDIDVKVTFPKNYQAKELAGKDAEFKTKVLAVHCPKAAELDDEFAKKFKCANVAELKEKVSASIKETYSHLIRDFMKMKLFDQLEGSLKFDVPESLLSREVEILKKQTSQEGNDPDIAKKSEKEKEEYYQKLALRRTRLGLMLAEYVHQNNLKIDENDIRQIIIKQAQNFPGQESQLISFYYNNPNALESLKAPALEEKAVTVIFDQEIKITDKKYPKNKLDKLLEDL